MDNVDVFAMSAFALPLLSFDEPFRRYICRSFINQTDGEEESEEIFEEGQEDNRKAEGYQEEGSHTTSRCSRHSTTCY
jgi:hypothetical protein